MPGVAGTDAIPGATLDVQTQMPVCWPRTLMIEVVLTLNPPFTFDPSKRYGIATLSYDHPASVAGPAADATHCGRADVGLCLVPAGNVGSFELPLLTWQRGACSGPTKTRAGTWGPLKQAYR